MKNDLLNYKPQNVEYVVPEEVADMFPHELDFLSIKGNNLKTKRDIIAFVNANFNCQFPQGEMAERRLDDFEIKNIREEYCYLTENKLLQKEKELELAIEEAKRIKREAEEALNSVRGDIKAYAQQAKIGNTEVMLKNKETFVIALAGYYVVYTWNDATKKFVLANGYEVLDQTEIFADETRNREVMMNLFGCEWEETPKNDTIDSDGLPFGGEELPE